MANATAADPPKTNSEGLGSTAPSVHGFSVSWLRRCMVSELLFGDVLGKEKGVVPETVGVQNQT